MEPSNSKKVGEFINMRSETSVFKPVMIGNIICFKTNMEYVVTGIRKFALAFLG